MSRTTVFDRLNYLRQDEYGVDPLSSTIYPSLLKLPVSFRHYVKDSEAGNPPLLSYNLYPAATVDLWWVIQEYNGIVHSKHLVAGLLLKLPQYGAILQHLQDATRSRTLVGVVAQSSSGQIVNASRTLKL